MIRSHTKTIFLSLFLILSTTSIAYAAPTPFILGYWGNWHVWATDKNGRSEDEYQIPGSINKDTGGTVVNPVFQQQMTHLTAVAYAFLDVYPDPGMYKDVPQKPVDLTQQGKVYWTDPWTDLFNDSITTQFCSTHYTTCYFAYNVEQDPKKPRPPVDPSQPWNYFKMGNFDAFSRLPGVKRFISIGGWYHEGSFENGAFKNPTNFVNSVIDIINKAKAEGGNIDGIDLDYEPPTGYTAENAARLVDLAKQLRQGLNQNGLQSVMITAAVFANPEKINQFGKDNWQAFSQVVNTIDLMGYDFHGLWDNPPVTGFQSNLYNDPNDSNPNDFSLVKAVDALKAMGVPAYQIVIGVPSYGRTVGGVASTNNGLYQAFDPKLVPQTDLDNGQVSYYRLMKQWMNQGYLEHALFNNGQASSVWAYNPANQQFVSYDNTAVVDAKATYMSANGLGGMMMWELINDLPPTDSNALVPHLRGQ